MIPILRIVAVQCRAGFAGSAAILAIAASRPHVPNFVHCSKQIASILVMLNNNKRRFRTYSRRIVNVASGRLHHPCFFMHVPKCGGTSISEALYATVPIHRRVGIIDANATRRATSIIHADKNEKFLYFDDLANGCKVYDLREKLLLMHMAWDTEMIHGHVLFSEQAHRHFGDVYRYVTLLREPIERTLSNFLHSVRNGLFENNLQRYLESDVFRIQGLSMLRYFSGTHPISPQQEAEALRRAKHNLRLFSVIGFLDDLDGFADDYAEVFGRRPKIFKYNQGQMQHPVPTKDQAQYIEAALATELELWEYVKSQRGIRTTDESAKLPKS